MSKKMDPNIVLTFITAFVVALLTSGIPALLQLRRDRSNLPQESIDKALEASKEALAMVESYRIELGKERTARRELEARVESLECDLRLRDAIINDWQVGIGRLLAQLISHQITPVWQPKPSEEGGKA